MAREFGTFQAAANYEPLIAAPFDARELVETRDALTNAATWTQANGDIWAYVGMKVSVSSDIEPSNNGLYVLINADWRLDSSWQKLADESRIEALEDKIEEIENAGAGIQSMTVETETDLPQPGLPHVTYYVLENNSIYRWQEETQSYLAFGGTSDEDITMIYGGNANE